MYVLKEPFLFNELNETVLLSTKNKYFKCWVRKYSQLEANFCSLSLSLFDPTYAFICVSIFQQPCV